MSGGNGRAHQDGLLPAGGEQDRVGGTGEVPGPEAGRDGGVRHRVVSPTERRNKLCTLRENIVNIISHSVPAPVLQDPVFV